MLKTALICHAEDAVDRDGIARWLASFSDLAGIVEIHEPRSRVLKRLKWERRRVGWLGLLDVAAFRFYYRALRGRRDAAIEEDILTDLRERYPADPTAPVFATDNPNSGATRDFLRELAPDVVIARCKFILKEAVYSIPRVGTFVLHPGICPQYRNAHGCFWALAEGDTENVGATLLKIDAGIDTGPVYGYYRYAYDESTESHHLIQIRCVTDNLDSIASRLTRIANGEAGPLDVDETGSRTWGQPRLSAELRRRRRVRRRRVSATSETS